MGNPLDIAIWKKRSAAFLAGDAMATGRLPGFQKQLMANVSAMRALDHTLDSIGLPLLSFVAARPLRPLKPSEKRYFCSAADLPKELASDCGFASRSCILDTESGERRLEASWHTDRRVLIECLDAGPLLGSVGVCSGALLGSGQN